MNTCYKNMFFKKLIVLFVFCFKIIPFRSRLTRFSSIWDLGWWWRRRRSRWHLTDCPIINGWYHIFGFSLDSCQSCWIYEKKMRDQFWAYFNSPKHLQKERQRLLNTLLETSLIKWRSKAKKIDEEEATTTLRTEGVYLNLVSCHCWLWGQ